LQGLVLPEQGLAPEETLFFRKSGAVGFSQKLRAFSFRAGSSLSFATWFNSFNMLKWRQNSVGDIYLKLMGHGRFEITVHEYRRGRSMECVYQETVEFAGAYVLPVSDVLAQSEHHGVLALSLTCLSDAGDLSEAVWMTDKPPRQTVEATIAITTFERGTKVAQLVKRLAQLRDAHLPNLRICVVNNGREPLDLIVSGVQVIECENFGGSGGFARGLIAAQDARSTHCVFMDDDAEVHSETLRRSFAFLAYARDPNTALAGAMIAQEDRRFIWENGASFHQFCKPHFAGTDLTQFQQSSEMDLMTCEEQLERLYGGWWFFAFPLSALRHYPFPFFLRGDDVSFSLAHAFKIQRLNGVAAYQQGFTSKENPRTWYLDIRSHLLHHLSLKEAQISAVSMLKIVVFFLAQTTLRMHYASAQAVLLGVSDVLRGPWYFADNANLTTRLNDVDMADRSERWQAIDATPGPLAQPSQWGALWLLLGNGAFLPGFSWWGRKVTLGAQDRRNLKLFWGASEVTVLHASEPLAYRVRHNKLAVLRLGFGFLRLSLRFVFSYRRLRPSYQASSAPLTSRAFWERKFNPKVVTS
jgi:GT2 family glycosyltransferase